MTKQDFLPEFYKGIAHRGLHDDKMTENGLKAFEAAINADTAFELDIHLTKDGKLLVCHDSELKRTTGKAGIIENLTFDEIRKDYRLLDGEVVPSFQEVLDLDKERRLIVVELKVYEKNYRALASAAKKALLQIKDPKKIVMISFDPRALFLMGHRYATGLLVCKEKEWVWKCRGLFSSVDLEFQMAKQENVIKYRKRGGIVNVWTIEKENDLKDIAPYVDTVTFQHLDPSLIQKSLSK